MDHPTYHDLYQGDAVGDTTQESMDRYPAGDDKTGKPKGKGKGGAFKKPVPKGGTKKKTPATTTSSPDDRMSPEDANKPHPGY